MKNFILILGYNNIIINNQIITYLYTIPITQRSYKYNICIWENIWYVLTYDLLWVMIYGY